MASLGGEIHQSWLFAKVLRFFVAKSLWREEVMFDPSGPFVGAFAVAAGTIAPLFPSRPCRHEPPTN